MDPHDAPTADAPAAEPPADPLLDPAASRDQRNWATGIHLTTLAQPLVGGLPLLALVLWLVKKEDGPFLDDHGREATNFQITLAIYYLLAIILTFVCIGFALVIGVYALGIVGVILSARAASRGRYYRYPMTLRLIPEPPDR